MSIHSIRVIFPLMFLLLLSACRSSSDVVSGRMIQKRKYTAGWYVEWGQCFGSKSDQHQEINSIELIPAVEELTAMNDKTEPVPNLEMNFSPDENQPLAFVAESVPAGKVESRSDRTNPLRRELTKTPVKFYHKLNHNPDETDPEKYLQEARESYRKTWMFTVLSMICLGAALVLFSNGFLMLNLFFGGALMAAAVVFYVVMFIHLQSAAVSMVDFEGFGGRMEENRVLDFFIRAHIIVGSLFCLLLCFIPLIIVYRRVNRERERFPNQ